MPWQVSLIIIACILYTVAVWWERIRGGLQKKIVIAFAAAFTCDLIATTAMRILSRSGKANLDFHALTGYTALAIMFVHFIFAVIAIWRSGGWAMRFHRTSVYAWLFWLLPFFTGAFLKHR